MRKSLTALCRVVKTKLFRTGTSRDLLVDRGDMLILIVVQGEFAGGGYSMGASL
jgi:hypothetical protein